MAMSSRVQKLILRFSLNFPLRFSSLIRYFTSSSSIPSNLERVGIIGLGNMGSHMAINLANNGYKVTVHDINHTALKRFSEMGMTTKETPFDLAESSDVVITMLPSPSHVWDVYTKKDGLLTNGCHLRPWLFIDSSTVDPHTSRNLSAKTSECLLKENKGSISNPVFLDAPVSGGVPGAEAGTLTFMVGGPEAAYEAAKPLFLSMGKNSIYCGYSGNGAAAKVCNNLVAAVSMLGVSEALVFGQKLGISAATLTEIFNSSSARCWSSDTYNPVPGVMPGLPSSRNYDGGFSSKLMAKDLGLAKEAAKEVSIKHPFTSNALHIYTKMCEKGYGSKDFSSVFRYYYSGSDERIQSNTAKKCCGLRVEMLYGMLRVQTPPWAGFVFYESCGSHAALWFADVCSAFKSSTYFKKNVWQKSFSRDNKWKNKANLKTREEDKKWAEMNKMISFLLQYQYWLSVCKWQ